MYKKTKISTCTHSDNRYVLIAHCKPQYRKLIISTYIQETVLKVMMNEKRALLKVVPFDRSPFMLFTLRFSNKSVQAPSCNRPKTARRTLFLFFANNVCFAITDFSHHTLNRNIGIYILSDI